MLLLAVVAGSAHATMVVDRTILTFSPGDLPRQDITVTNPDTENLYLEVTVLEVTDPGTEQETREAVKDPESIGLIAAPQRLMIAPGARHNIRLVNLNGHSEKEKVFRVNITPTPPPAKTEGMAIRVLVAYQLLIFVEPQVPKEKLQVVRNGQFLQIINKGNINVMLTNGQQCTTPQQESCQPVEGKRLYPGNELRLSLPAAAGPVFFRATSRGETRIREF